MGSLMSYSETSAGDVGLMTSLRSPCVSAKSATSSSGTGCSDIAGEGRSTTGDSDSRLESSREHRVWYRLNSSSMSLELVFADLSGSEPRMEECAEFKVPRSEAKKLMLLSIVASRMMDEC